METLMGKSRRTAKEFTREQALSNENKKLKRELSILRKKIARLDLDQYTMVRDVVESHEMEDKSKHTENLLESLKETWKCRECTAGYLEIVIFTKLGEPWYFRSCNLCRNRTHSQRYDSTKVKGIVKNG